ncbi:MAG: hypothetical protein IKE66_11620 [Hyphomicrobium sp.]|nr:hypothetical protein [Hyphomicrobium sp.]
MFAALINRAQATVDNAIGQVFNRALIAIPFILAGAFATAALAFRLVREFGPETANLMLAGLFLVVGLLSAAVFRARPAAATAGEEPLPEALAGSEDATASKPLDAPDRELLMAAFTSAAPIAVPALLRTIIRNLPLVLAILSALFVLTRPSEQSAEADAPAS